MYSTPSRFEQGLVQRDLVNGLPMPPCVTMITFAPRILATGRCDRSKTEPTPAWPEPSHSTKSFSQATRSKAFWIFLTRASLFEDWRYLRVEIRLDGDGAHVTERTVQAEHGIHQHDVLINFLLLDLDEPLADGLDVAHARIMFLEGSDQTQGRGGFPVILGG